MIAESLQFPLVRVKSALPATSTSGILKELLLTDTRNLALIPSVTLPILRDSCTTLSLYVNRGDIHANSRSAGESLV
jgi:hypothetical protein